MEFWSLYNETLELVKEGHPSCEPIPEGLYHLTVEVWSYDGAAFFLTRRALTKKHYPGYWECTGGSAVGKESFEEAAVREVQEELGLCVRGEMLERMSVDVRDTHIVAVFLLRLPERAEFRLNDREIMEGRWFTVQELESLHLDMRVVPHQFERYLAYIRKQAFQESLRSKPVSVRRLLEVHGELRTPVRGLPFLGSRPDGAGFSPVLAEINDAFSTYGDTLYARRTVLPESVNNSLGSGSPLSDHPFPPAAAAIKNALETTLLSQYPLPAGDLESRRVVCEYLHQEGFSRQITPENIIFTSSTTQANHLILKLLLRPSDTVLFTAPTYGLFAFAPERLGGRSRFLPLSMDDGWLVDPDKLDASIKETNRALAEGSPDTANAPRVVAFFNENPHNPTGKVMGKKQAGLLKRIASVCRENGVFVIDDLLYRDLCYDPGNIAMPIAAFDDEHRNTISLLGLSKAYGLAGLRAGMVVADEVIIRGLRNLIFQETDSSSYLNAVALASAFNTSERRNAAYKAYFSAAIDRYRFNLSLLKAAVDSIGLVEEAYAGPVKAFVRETLGSEEASERWLSGIDEISFIDQLMPESGFFCLLDFTGLKGKRCGDMVIEDDISLLVYMFHRYRVNFITGKSMGWPDSGKLIARISYSVAPEKLVNVFRYIKEEIGQLT